MTVSAEARCSRCETQTIWVRSMYPEFPPQYLDQYRPYGQLPAWRCQVCGLLREHPGDEY